MYRLIAISVMDRKYMYVGVALLGLGLFMGHLVTSIIFFGILSASSLIFLVESSSKRFKMLIGKYGFVLDLILFVLSAIAVAYLGVTVAGGLAVASLIFTVYRLNFLKPWYDRVKHTVVQSSLSIKEVVAGWFNKAYDGIKSGWSFVKGLFNSKKDLPCVEI